MNMLPILGIEFEEDSELGGVDEDRRIFLGNRGRRVEALMPWTYRDQ